MSYIFYAMLIYLLYRFIAGFVLPVAKATSQVKKQFRTMHEQAQAQQGNTGTNNGRTAYTGNSGVDQKPKYDVEGEYIKFEEIKE